MNQIINTNTITHDINNFKAVFSQDRKIIGLDVGKKTIGIAISDPISKIALTHKTIFRKKLKEDLQMLQEIINDNTVVSIVIGLWVKAILLMGSDIAIPIVFFPTSNPIIFLS